MKQLGIAPQRDEFEFTLLGPGYGESIVLHVGDGVWVIVDSCVDSDNEPRALKYMESIGVDPTESVNLIVATHWHDDHIRGIARLVEICSRAMFCCASSLCKREFLAIVHALENRQLSYSGSGLREIYRVFSHLRQAQSHATRAISNRRIFVHSDCEIWSLSPNDKTFETFIKSICDLVGQGDVRVPGMSPNQVAVALWIKVRDVIVLLGSDLEECSWIDILQSTARPMGRASAYKVPHHGSENSDHLEVWNRMLEKDPYALLTPWSRGGRVLPTTKDVSRILASTPNAYATARTRSITRAPLRRSNLVERTIRNPRLRFAGFLGLRGLFD